MLDTVDLFRNKGIQTVGAGRNLREARQPAILERNGIRVAILAYCSVLHEGYAAGPDKPGIAPLRAHTYYEPIEYQAGMPPRVVTMPTAARMPGTSSEVVSVRTRMTDVPSADIATTSSERKTI